MARPALSGRGQALRIVCAIPALVAIFGFGEAILDRRAWRLDLTPERRYTLSEHARRVVESLPADVRILAFLRAQDPRNPGIEDLLRQVAGASPRVHVEQFDVNRSPALARQYEVDSYGALVVESEGRRRVVNTPREEVLVAAFLQVTRQQRKTVAWVLGHGEGDLASSDRRLGYLTARTALELDYFDVHPASLFAGEVPAGTDVVVVVGPEKDFLPDEIRALDHWIEQGGATLVLLDPQRAPRVAEDLGRWGIVLAPDVVVDPGARLYGGEGISLHVDADGGSHPLLAGLRAGMLFSATRSVGLAEGVDGDVLLWSGPQGFATTAPEAFASGSVGFDPQRDRPGPVSVGAEVRVAPLAEPGETVRGPARLVVYGNSRFANNFFIEYLGNRDLFVDTVQWLARDLAVMGHRTPRQTPGIQQFYMTEEQGSAAFWTAAVVQPLVLAAVGLALAARRRWGR